MQLYKDENVSIVASAVFDEAPVTVTPLRFGVNLKQWAADHVQLIEQVLQEHGAILFRKFKVNGSGHFQDIIEGIYGVGLTEYENRSTPRTRVKGNVYTSTEYPANETIPLHNENAYTNKWANRIFFFCVKPSAVGGQTPIADSRRVFQAIPPATREKLIQQKIRYTRNYGHFDLHWHEVFQTTDPAEVEAYCRNNDIHYQWRPDGQLTTWQICDAVQTHPKTGEMVWFNQAHLFHVSALQAEVRESLLQAFSSDLLPRNAFYGDGSEFEESVLADIRAAFVQEKRVFNWQMGDVLLLDNMLFAHGREPFEGERQVLVGMVDPRA
ncbi:taurine catabolism dioxygenase TauD [Rheinheimera sp. SA_1]|uniref:TauD/TfdA family dioxygenase n=1 Tax=Rheinheimera sp. SA_1 TaxID=1827365 RepID=UPI0007FC6FBA|nr:TauD/TfdA family dioxygenase [Rheinheimera sp. SA_1]OBP16331.1 taurine catabolism dioxygenase TauD [Rheinheimera sp. SA_1]